MSSVPMSRLKIFKYISLPGTHITTYVETSLVPNSSFITVGWILNNYKPFEYKFKQKSKHCSNFSYLQNTYICLSISRTSDELVKRKYYIVFKTKTDTSKISWNEASTLCRKIGGYLPHFQSKDKLNELLALYKLSKEIPFLTGIYIGLKSSEVSLKR